MHVLIAGGGIGGLTAALALRRIGVDVTVIEAAAVVRPLGVGINILPHGAAVLTKLGLGGRLQSTAIQTRAIEYRTEFGQVILRDPRGLHAGSPWPQYSIHRGELQMMLFDALLKNLPRERLMTGLRLERFEQDGTGVTVWARNGDGRSVELRADVLVGADGIHSQVCAQLHPLLKGLAFSGTIMWRGAVERQPFLDGETMIIAGHHDSKAVIYPISREAMHRGNALVNWVAEINVGKDKPYEQEDWSRIARMEEFIAPFARWKFDCIDVPALFRSTERIFVYPMVDRDPLPRWTHGRVTLLGDAAHPMYPIGANGASQAILDADALASAFVENTTRIENALENYDRNRRPATSAIVSANRTKGPEAALQLARERVHGPNDDVAALITREEIDSITKEYQLLAGFDAASLSRRAGEKL